jgi:hypothetical protein
MRRLALLFASVTLLFSLASQPQAAEHRTANATGSSIFFLYYSQATEQETLVEADSATGAFSEHALSRVLWMVDSMAYDRHNDLLYVSSYQQIFSLSPQHGIGSLAFVQGTIPRISRSSPVSQLVAYDNNEQVLYCLQQEEIDGGTSLRLFGHDGANWTVVIGWDFDASAFGYLTFSGSSACFDPATGLLHTQLPYLKNNIIGTINVHSGFTAPWISWPGALSFDQNTGVLYGQFFVDNGFPALNKNYIVQVDKTTGQPTSNAVETFISMHQPLAVGGSTLSLRSP